MLRLSLQKNGKDNNIFFVRKNKLKVFYNICFNSALVDIRASNTKYNTLNASRNNVLFLHPRRVLRLQVKLHHQFIFC